MLCARRTLSTSWLLNLTSSGRRRLTSGTSSVCRRLGPTGIKGEAAADSRHGNPVTGHGPRIRPDVECPYSGRVKGAETLVRLLGQDNRVPQVRFLPGAQALRPTRLLQPRSGVSLRSNQPPGRAVA